ncbi:MAG: Gx transporter family protein [Clostridia bacterium]|nr:Gx transporter family protein [Clostridia bacterium]
MKTKKPSPAYRVAVVGILSAEAVVLSFLESLLPPLTFLPPGAKLGLANVAVMFTVVWAGLPAALAVTAVKALYVLITRGLSAFWISLCGGLCSVAVMYFLTRTRQTGRRRSSFGYIGISVLSATAHNLGQLGAASAIAGAPLIAYLPLLVLFGIFFGSVTGTVLGVVMPVLEKQSRIFSNKNKQVKDYES